MTILAERPAGCLAPIVVDPVVEDPDSIRELARNNGPYAMPARYLVDGEAADDAVGQKRKRDVDVPSYLIGPVWRGNWSMTGNVLVPGTEYLLQHGAFIAAAKDMCDAEVVVPEQVYVNLTSPMGGNAFSHTDIPEFVGMDRTNTPGWLLQAMGGSRLFEPERITIVTAVAWFHQGERGYFRYWPNGRDADSVRHEDMWNSAVVGDNDFMHHKVERVGPDTMGPPQGMTIDTALDHDGEQWVVLDDGNELARYDDEHVRLSLSWKAKVFADEGIRQRAVAGVDGLDLATVLGRMEDELGSLPATGEEALQSAALRELLSSRWSGYRLD